MGNIQNRANSAPVKGDTSVTPLVIHVFLMEKVVFLTGNVLAQMQ